MKFKTSLLKFSGFSIFDMCPTPGNITFLELGILASNILATSIILLPRLVVFSNSPISIRVGDLIFLSISGAGALSLIICSTGSSLKKCHPE